MNKIAIITGGSGTLGLELINKYLKEGYIIYAIYNNILIDVKHKNLFKYKYDLEKETEFLELVNGVAKDVNNESIISIIHAAGIYTKSSIEDFNYEEFYKYISVNSTSFLCLYSKLFNIIKKSLRCNIILISSNLLKRINSGSIYYTLSKSINNQIIKHISYEHGKYNIIANAIEPGLFISNMNNNIDNRKLDIIRNNIPIRKILTAYDLASFIFNFTDNNQYIVGEIITIDGGNTIGY